MVVKSWRVARPRIIMRSGDSTPVYQSVAWEKLFRPSGIAIVGASADSRRIGGQPVKFLTTYGYPGHVLPVNPSREDINGLRCYPSIDAIDLPCDVALIAVNAKAAVQAVSDCGKKGISFAVILSSGFREAGPDGIALEQEMLNTAHQYGVRVIGPNCLGYLNLENRLYATFGVLGLEPKLRQGAISMVTQSGGFGFSVVTLAEIAGLGFRRIVSSGNEADVTTPELLDGYVDDPGTKVLMASVEGVSDGRSLMRVADRAARAGKPLFMWKTGNSDVGKQASLSHTANLTGDYSVYRAAFSQSGILEVHDIDEIIDKSRAILAGKLPQGKRVAALGSSAGSCILFADRCAELGLELPPLASHTEAALTKILPAFGSPRNPVDVTADIYNDVDSFRDAVALVLEDPNIDQLAILFAGLSGDLAQKCVLAVVKAAKASNKPVMLGWSARRHRAEAAYECADSAAIPYFTSPARLANAASALAQFAMYRKRALDRELFIRLSSDLNDALPNSRGTLSERESKKLLESWGISCTNDLVVNLDENPVECCREISYPVAVKILSSDIPHKTEAGGVVLGVSNIDELAEAVKTVLSNAKQHAPHAHIDGVLVSEMVTDGVEMLLGVVADPTFGPTVVLGMGGVQAELLRDVTHRIAPFDISAVHEMLDELRCGQLLKGYRGRPVADTEALAVAVSRLSEYAWAHRERITELDINPLFVRPRGLGVAAADAMVCMR